MTDLSVIIVSYNTRDLLGRCLSSVSGASASMNSEIWVVDNGSADGSADTVERDFPRVRLIRNPDNRGFARACNQGMERAGGKYLLLLNSDAMIDADALSGMVAFMERTPDAGMA